MNKSISDSSLSQLRSMKELQQAKMKLNRAIKYAEQDMKDEYTNAKDMFSWTNTICMGFSVMDGLQSVGRYLGKGLYTGVTKLFRRRQRRREELDNDCY